MRVRSKFFGTAERPRLTVFRSNRHLYLQVVNDEQKKTLVSVNDSGKEKKLEGNKTERAKQLAADLAKQMTKAKIKKLSFDRGGYRYHGRIKAVAEVLREAGVEV